MNYRLAAIEMRREIADRHAWNPVQQPKDPLSIWHLCYLVEQLTKVEFTEGKANRWLGWAQAIYCLHGFGTLESLKALNEACSCDDEGCPQFNTVHVHTAQPKWKEGFHWFTSERATQRAVGQYLNGQWYIVGEAAPLRYADITWRGWRVDSYIGPADTMSEDED